MASLIAKISVLEVLVMQQKTSGRPVLGDWFEFEYATSIGVNLELTGIVDLSSTPDHIVLSEVMIFMATGGAHQVGVKTLLRFKKELLVDIRSLGYSSVTISGERISGASPGKFVCLTF